MVDLPQVILLLQLLKQYIVVSANDSRIAIKPDKFDKLITLLRTAVDNDGTLDKESTSCNDIFDAFRLAIRDSITFKRQLIKEYK